VRAVPVLADDSQMFKDCSLQEGYTNFLEEEAQREAAEQVGAEQGTE